MKCLFVIILRNLNKTIGFEGAPPSWAQMDQFYLKVDREMRSITFLAPAEVELDKMKWREQNPVRHILLLNGDVTEIPMVEN